MDDTMQTSENTGNESGGPVPQGDGDGGTVNDARGPAGEASGEEQQD